MPAEIFAVGFEDSETIEAMISLPTIFASLNYFQRTSLLTSFCSDLGPIIYVRSDFSYDL